MTNERVLTGRGLLWKLLTINLPILVLVLVAVWLAIDMLAADYFSELMKRYHINPEEAHGMFLDAIHRYLIWTMSGAVLLATLASYLLTRRVLRPLREMASVTGKVASGDYTARALVHGNDELARLAEALNAMASSLEAMEKQRKDLVADVAHELRTPLTNVRGYLEALRDGVVAPDEATYNMLHEEIQRLVTLSDDLFHLSQADAARANLERETIDLTALIHSALKQSAPLFERRRICTRERHSDGPQMVYGDRQKLAQAIGNLVANGWQHGTPDGDFEIETRHQAGVVRALFTNPVERPPDGEVELIFERFYRLERSRSREYGGAGIGLAIVKELIEAHGGRVGAQLIKDRLQVWLELPTAA
jgi:signal transduction histidine kinase